jgi:hypothetical protein
MGAEDDGYEDSHRNSSEDPGESRWAAGDDERENREHIARTGEPERDALGNGEGAS